MATDTQNISMHRKKRKNGGGKRSSHTRRNHGYHFHVMGMAFGVLKEVKNAWERVEHSSLKDIVKRAGKCQIQKQ